MFNRYKSEITQSEYSSLIEHNSDYEKCIDELVMANQNLDKSSKEYHDLVCELPLPKFDKLEKDTEIRLFKNIIGLLNIEAHIGNKKMKFLFDTGAQVSCINSKYLSTGLGICDTDKEIEVGDSSGTFDKMKIALIDRIDVMDLKVTNLPMLVLNEKQLSLKVFGKTLYEIDGILGWDIINRVDFELDYENLTLKICKDKCDFSNKNLVKSSFPVVLLTDENGNIRKFGIDTGARKSWVNMKLINHCDLKILKELREKTYGAHGVTEQDAYLIEEYCVYLLKHKITFRNIKTGYTKLLNDYEFDGVLGLDSLKKMNMQFINSRESLIFK
jgi:hypothetical protein